MAATPAKTACCVIMGIAALSVGVVIVAGASSVWVEADPVGVPVGTAAVVVVVVAAALVDGAVAVELAPGAAASSLFRPAVMVTGMVRLLIPLDATSLVLVSVVVPSYSCDT